MPTIHAPRPAFRLHPLLWAGAAGLLLIPAVAMIFTREVNWGSEDFVAMGAMLAPLCLSLEAAWHWLDTPVKRFAGTAAALVVFLLVWAELAVGIFD